MAVGGFVAYYRVSTARQGRSGLGLDAQRAAVAAYLNGGNWKIIGEFTEVESGRRSDRPELDKALALARVHRAPLVVAKVDRLTRSVAFLSRLLESGADVRFADLPQIEGPTGRFMLTQLAAVAEIEAGLISARTKAALAAAKARGRKLGGDRGALIQKVRRAGAQARKRIADAPRAGFSPHGAGIAGSGQPYLSGARSGTQCKTHSGGARWRVDSRDDASARQSFVVASNGARKCPLK